MIDTRAAGLAEAADIIDEMRMIGAGKTDPRHSGQRGMDRSDALAEAYRAIKTRAKRPATAMEAGQWPKVEGERVLIYVVHPDAKLEPDEAIRKARWEGWFSAHWTSFNHGGWVWHGMIGDVTHVAPLPLAP